MILSLVDRASGPAQNILGRIFGGTGKAGKRVGGEIDSAGMSARAANGAMLALNRSMMTFAAGAAGYIGFKGMIGGAIEFESSMAEVAKLVEATPEQMAQLEKAIKKVASTTPIASKEMAGLVAQAGQFGIPTKDLARFAEFGAKTSGAFQMGAEETGEALSQIRNALGLTMTEMEHYADAINYVADKNGSSERQLVDFVLRTGAGAKAAGLDPKDLLAIGSAMTEVGLSSQRSGTAVNAMLTKMTEVGKKGTILDKIGGKGYSKRLQKQFFENPRKALVDMLRVTKQMSRPDRAGFFKELFGLETQDEANALAGNIDKVVQTVEQLGDATNYVGSVQRTFDIFQKTTEGQWKTFKNNVEMASAAMGAKLLPAINGGLGYLNNFFATAEGRIDIFERLSEATNGFFTGLGYTGGTADALERIADAMAPIRDLLFGVQGDANFGVGGLHIFESWRKFGEEMANSPITKTLDTIKNTDLGGLGSGLMAGAAGLGALGFLAKLALSPLRAIFAVLKATAGVALTLSGLRTAKWLFDVIGKGGGPDIAKSASKGGGLLAALAPWIGAVLKSPIGKGGIPAIAAAVTAKALIEKGPNDPRMIHPGQAPINRNESAARTGNPLTGATLPAPQAGPTQEPVPFSWGQLWRDLASPVGGQKQGSSSGPQAVNVSGPVTTVPSGIQQVTVTNPPPANVISVTVHAVTNAAPAEIGAAVGHSVSAALRGAYGDVE
ncbi:phage tail tape measure protein [Mesorhizobium sp. DCY119]|nr:phage tail tape measure protein [Mesorhizobium sp. DCY119]